MIILSICEQVVALDGFSDTDFDALWRYFEQTCGVCPAPPLVVFSSFCIFKLDFQSVIASRFGCGASGCGSVVWVRGPDGGGLKGPRPPM